MPDSENFVRTHKSVVLHIRGKPVACIVEENKTHYIDYETLRSSNSVFVFTN